MPPLISIIIPVYNKSSYIKDTITTLQKQTYFNWHAIFINDCSTDHSIEVIKTHMQGDYDIIDLKDNVGVAEARNIGIRASKGRYIAFLDADDLWHPDKLKKQIDFMQKNQYAFTFTDYEYATPEGIGTGRTTHIPTTMTYEQSLKDTTIFTSTVMIDTHQICKEEIYMPNVPYEDTATWWHLLKKYGQAYGIQEVLSLYRTGHKSLSSNKLVAIGRMWNLYRTVEGLSILKSIYCFIFYAWNAFFRRF